MSKEYTEKQTLFLKYLFTEEVGGDPVKAKKLAGYSDTTPTLTITKALKEEITEACFEYIASQGPKASFALSKVLDNPTEMGVSHKIVAAKELLDRCGIKTADKVELGGSGILILPAKDIDNDES